MKKFLPFFAFATLLLAGQSLFAQSENKKWSIGFGLEGGLPTGDIKDSYTFTAGITLRFAYKAGPGFATFTTGVVGFDPKKGQGDQTKAALQIPFKVGYKYIFVKHLFVMGEIGYSKYRYYYDGGNNNLVSTSTGGFTYAPTIGATFGVFDAGIKYEAISVTGGTISNIGLRLGFNF